MTAKAQQQIDVVRRAMPLPQSKSLTNQEVYGATT